jgi:hypothetical protein
MTKFLTGTKRSIPQQPKTPPRVLSELYYEKLLGESSLIWFNFYFFKQKHVKKRTKRTLNIDCSCQLD